MVSLLFAGITLSSFDKEVMPELLTQGLQTPEGGRLLIGMLAGFIPEWWPTSNRNTRPVWIGIRTLVVVFAHASADPVVHDTHYVPRVRSLVHRGGFDALGRHRQKSW